MTIIVDSDNALQAWQEGCHQLCNSDSSIFNMVTTISQPSVFDESWLTDFNTKSFNAREASLIDVVNTIFPYRLRQRHPNRHEFYKAYIARHIRAKRMRPRSKRWGTYFERLISFGGNSINQLEEIICTLEHRQRDYHASLVMHTSSAETDSLIKTIGNPCLQYLELLSEHPNSLSLLVVYRNHDYLNKAFGNFIGLSKLLEFICNEAGKQPGNLICHSAHAYFNCSKNAIKKFAKIDQDT
jgi:thymidylate synthase